MAAQYPLFARLPQFHELTNDLVLDRFLEYVQEKKLTLYSAQEEAVLALFEGQNVILNTPTGSGKSLVATALHFHSLAMGKRSVYTCPIKALVNEKFMALCRDFGPEQVGIATGDGSVNRDAPILCCTAEILSQMALREGELAKVDDVIMDEFHYYADRERGAAWQILLLAMPQTRFLLMSATLGDVALFERELTALNGRATAVVTGTERPVPLKFEYLEKHLHEAIKELIDRDLAPIYLVNFSQREATEEAQNLMSVDFLTKDLKREITESLSGVKFSSPFGKEIQKYLKHGVGVHHAGLLPKYRVLVERLAQSGRLKVISGTDTLGVGVNVPIRSVLLSKLCKYDGEKTAILSVRDFHQIAGRAGRKGYDDVGHVFALAPEHVVENLKLDQKAKADPKKAKKIVKAKPPERGFVMWNAETFQRLINGRPEALQSRFQVTHSMLLSVLARENQDGCRALRELIRASHETLAAKKKHRAHGFKLFRSLVERGILEFIPTHERTTAQKVRVHVSLQDDFSLDRAMSLWLIDTLAKLDRESATYALDVLTLVEAVVENPDVILNRQLDRAKTALMFELKAQGVEYEQRMEELEKVEYPKPLRDFIYATFNEFTDAHPWIDHENVRPKSVVREMYETYQSFAEYVREYDLERAEGVLLRYLSETFRVLTQTVPEGYRSEEVEAVVEYLGAMVRDVDSTLMDDWQRMRSGADSAASTKTAAESQIESNRERERLESERHDEMQKQRLKVAKRIAQREVFRLLRALSVGDCESAAAIACEWAAAANDRGRDNSDHNEWSEERFKAFLDEFRESGHTRILIDPAARAAHFTRVSEPSGGLYTIEQTVVDPDAHNDVRVVVSAHFDEAGLLKLSLVSLLI